MLRRILLALLAGCFAAGVIAQTDVAPPKKKSQSKRAAKKQEQPAEQNKPAEEKKDAGATAPGKSADDDNAGAEAVQKIFVCLSAGLPQEWRRAWVVVTEVESDGKERTFEGKFFYSLDPEGAKPLELKTCGAEEVGKRVYGLNAFLEFDKRNWKVATLVFSSEGKFELKYDYPK